MRLPHFLKGKDQDLLALQLHGGEERGEETGPEPLPGFMRLLRGQGLTVRRHRGSRRRPAPFISVPTWRALGRVCFNTTLSSREFGTHMFLLTPTRP